MSVFDKFKRTVDIPGLKEDLKKSKSGKNDFPTVPEGNYEVEIEKLQPAETKSGNPALSVWFKIINGNYKNSKLFMTQPINFGFGLHKANEFLRSLGTSKEIVFDDFTQYENLLLDIAEEIVEQQDYELSYTINSKGYSEFGIEDIFEMEK